MRFSVSKNTTSETVYIQVELRNDDLAQLIADGQLMLEIADPEKPSEKTAIFAISLAGDFSSRLGRLDKP